MGDTPDTHRILTRYPWDNHATTTVLLPGQHGRKERPRRQLIALRNMWRGRDLRLSRGSAHGLPRPSAGAARQRRPNASKPLNPIRIARRGVVEAGEGVGHRLLRPIHDDKSNAACPHAAQRPLTLCILSDQRDQASPGEARHIRRTLSRGLKSTATLGSSLREDCACRVEDHRRSGEGKLRHPNGP